MSSFAAGGVVEKASYDDFYLEAPAAPGSAVDLHASQVEDGGGGCGDRWAEDQGQEEQQVRHACGGAGGSSGVGAQAASASTTSALAKASAASGAPRVLVACGAPMSEAGPALRSGLATSLRIREALLGERGEGGAGVGAGGGAACAAKAWAGKGAHATCVLVP